MMVTDFSITAIGRVITITDISTANYGNEIVTDRIFLVVKSNGTSVVVPMPLVLGPGDITTYTLDKDSAISIKLTIIPDIQSADSIYVKIKNVLLVDNLLTALNQLRAEKILNGCYECEDFNNRDLKKIELLDNCLITAKNYISTDLIRAQKALDVGNELLTYKDC